MPFRTQTIAWDSAAFSALAAASAILNTSPSPRAFEKRQSEWPPHLLSASNCGAFASADNVDTGHNVENLLNGEVKRIAPKSCNRAGCFNTSGVYICNDNDYEIEITNADANILTDKIASTCTTGGEGRKGISGQAWTTDHGGFNVVVAYCDAANDPVDTLPSKYNPTDFKPSVVTCGRDGFGECNTGTCLKDQVKMHSSDNVACNVYLGANTIPAGDTYTYSTTRTVGTTWTVGGFLGIDTSDLRTVAAQAGFFASFEQTITAGSITGTSARCGAEGVTGDFTCGLQVSPGCVRMKGTCFTSSRPLSIPYDTTQPKQAAADGQGVWSASICTCRNCCGSTDVNAPRLDCFEDCATCVTLPDPCTV